MIWLLRLFALHAMFFVGILVCQGLFFNNNAVTVADAFTSMKVNTVQNSMKHVISQRPMKLSVFSGTRDKASDAAAVTSTTFNNLEMLLQQPSEISNESAPFRSDLSQVAPATNANGAIMTTDIETRHAPPEQQQSELSIWAARGLLLLVAAIWGTNFAVRSNYFG
jgi:hypothetical protein